MKLSKQLFNGRLYAEGLKRLRVLGFGVLLLALTASVLFPAVQLIEDLRYADHYIPSAISVTNIEVGDLCSPLAFLPFVTPIFMLVVFSFLFKRMESDFYHSIPYTRTCVYITYTTAALTWVLGITVLSGAAAGLLWAVNPYTTFVFTDLVMWILASCFSSLLFCAFMALAVSLCGNLTSTLLNFLVFICLPPIAMYIMNIRMEAVLPVSIPAFCGGLFTLKWYLPLSVFELMRIELNINMDLYDASVYICVAVVSLIIFVVAGFCYQRRKSEMAGNSAPSVRVQHVFRCLFTLPFALITMALIYSNDEMIALVLGVVTVVVYYLYELIVTKRLKGLWKITPRLAYVVIGCLVLLLAVQGVRQAVLRWEIDADEIAEVEIQYPRISSENYRLNSRVQDEVFQDYRSDDPVLIQAVADTWKNTQKYLLKSDDRMGNCVTIRLKNGREIIRYMRYSQEIENYFMSLPEFRAHLVRVPVCIEQVSYSYSYYERIFYETREDREQRFELKTSAFDDRELITSFRECFIKEYLALSEEEQYRLQDECLDLVRKEVAISIRIETAPGDSSSMLICILPDLMPETYAWLCKIFLYPETLPQ